jgi:predicted MFS family arabinose efflux permease
VPCDSAILRSVARLSVDGHTIPTSRRSALFAAVVGHPATRRLAIAHAFDDFADSLITLSLVGSLFFSVSLEASRGRILLYLLLTAAPLAVVAPVIGPVLDRMRVGYRVIVIGSHLARAVFALLLASSLLSVAFYPLVFGILLSRKAYDVAKTAMVAHLVPDRAELVAASGHLARTGTIAAGCGTAAGGALIAAFGVKWLPLAAAAGFVAAATLASRIPATSVDSPLHSAVVRAQTPVDVRRATVAVAGIRAAAGALTFLLALTIKRGGGDKWIFVAALVAAGVGTFLGTMVSSRLHRSFSPDWVLALTLLVPGFVSAFGVLTIGSLSIVAIALAIGLGGSVASREMDALYGRVPRLVRGRVIARAEVVFQIANVSGAAIAVLAYPGPRVGFAIVAAVLTVGGLVYASQLRLSLRQEAGMWLLGQRPGGAVEALPAALVAGAMRYAEQGEHSLAVAVAETAVRVLDTRSAAPAESVALDNWAALGNLVASVAAGTVEPTAEMSVAVIKAAAALVAERGVVVDSAVPNSAS